MGLFLAMAGFEGDFADDIVDEVAFPLIVDG